jgi:exosome complex component RRP43
VITGIKAEVSEGLLDDPRRGFIVPNVHFAAGAHAKVRPGPPSELVQSLTHRIDECFSRFCVVDPSKLVVQEGLVWALYIDIVVLNDEGSIWDAIWHSVIAALQDTLLPEIAMDATAGVVTIIEESKSPLELECRPIPVSALYYPEKDCYLLHPTASETALSSAVPIELLFDKATLKILYGNRETSRRAPKSQVPVDDYKSTVLQLLQ